ncbi:MAG: YicC/YloC family endoribonuclease [Bacillota bacterium]
MTGYGCAEAITPGGKIVVEVKAVNHRFSDIVIRLPRTYGCFEDMLRKLVQSVSTRGRVEVFLNIEETGNKNTTVKVDRELAMAYYKALEDLREHLGLEKPVSLNVILAQSGVLGLNENQTDVSLMGPFIESAAKTALSGLLATREAEGKNLEKDIRERLRHIKDICTLINIEAPRVVDYYRERLSERIKDIAHAIDPARLMGEIALFAERTDITEELVRIGSHITRAEEILGCGEPAGRRLDFLLQEMFREINTIGAKAQNLNVSQMIVDAKSELEKMREQVQNLE